MKCPDTLHAYQPWGLRLLCPACGDVLDPKREVVATTPRPKRAPKQMTLPLEQPAEPTVAQTEAEIGYLREAVSLLRGGRNVLDEPMPDEAGFDPAAERPRVYSTPDFDDKLPDPGV